MQIVAEDLQRSYPMGDASIPVLRGVSLAIERGEYLALTGPSGSGKSTLLHLLGCLDRPSAGRYRLCGRALETLDDEELSQIRNRTMGFVFQAFYLIPALSVGENVEVPLVYRGLPKPRRAALAADALERVGLSNRAQHRPDQLSGGERQRAAIARALVGEPEIILADEPTGSLDTETGNAIADLLESHRAEGTTLIVVTHDAGLAARADRVVRLQDGRIVS
jgi:putative ABC transport system ATP-binding protein